MFRTSFRQCLLGRALETASAISPILESREAASAVPTRYVSSPVLVLDRDRCKDLPQQHLLQYE